MGTKVSLNKILIYQKQRMILGAKTKFKTKKMTKMLKLIFNSLNNWIRLKANIDNKFKQMINSQSKTRIMLIK